MQAQALNSAHSLGQHSVASRAFKISIDVLRKSMRFSYRCLPLSAD